MPKSRLVERGIIDHSENEGTAELEVWQLCLPEQIPRNHCRGLRLHGGSLPFGRGEELRSKSVVHAAGAAEVGNAGGNGDAGAGKEDHLGGRGGEDGGNLFDEEGGVGHRCKFNRSCANCACAN